MKFEIPAEQSLRISTSTLDTNVSWFDRGNGDTILFIHGLGSTKESWLKNTGDLCEQYRCIIPDLPGYGISHYQKFKPDARHYAALLLQWLDEMHPEQISAIAGHSMGGLVAGYMAAMAPEKFPKLILVAPAGFETFNLWQQQSILNTYNPLLLRNVTDEQIEWNYRLNFYHLPEDAQILIDLRKNLRYSPHYDQYCHTVAANIKHMVSGSFRGIWEKVSARALLLHGAEDKLIPNPLSGKTVQEHLENVKSRYPQFRLISIRKAGHFVMWERADLCNQLLKAFMEEKEAN